MQIFSLCFSCQSSLQPSTIPGGKHRKFTFLNFNAILQRHQLCQYEQCYISIAPYIAYLRILTPRIRDSSTYSHSHKIIRASTLSRQLLTVFLRVSCGLSARTARRTKSRGPKGLQLEVGPKRGQRLLVYYILIECESLSSATWNCEPQQQHHQTSTDEVLMSNLLIVAVAQGNLSLQGTSTAGTNLSFDQ